MKAFDKFKKDSDVIFSLFKKEVEIQNLKYSSEDYFVFSIISVEFLTQLNKLLMKLSVDLNKIEKDKMVSYKDELSDKFLSLWKYDIPPAPENL